jgi:hypothetical protein
MYRVSMPYRLLFLLVPILPTVGLLVAAFRGDSFILLFGAPLAAFMWFSFLSLPLEVDLRSDALYCRSRLRTSVVPVFQIRAIDARAWNRGFIRIRHSSGSFFMLRSMVGVFDLIGMVRTINPRIECRGC